jgi:hypothetical protein
MERLLNIVLQRGKNKNIYSRLYFQKIMQVKSKKS